MASALRAALSRSASPTSRAFFPAGRQGTALGIFGVGNVGAAVTKFLAPFVLLAWGWQSVAQVWAAALVVMAAVFWFSTGDDPVMRARRAGEAAPQRSFWQEFAPLANVQVWRFALYYFFAFGAFVALALWLPRYLIGVYGFSLATAGMIGAAYSVPASIFRAYGGVLSDRIGARTVLYWTFAVSAVATLILSLPPADYVVHGTSGPIAFHFAIGPVAFIVVIFVLGFFMSLGKAAVYKHIPAYYPGNVGAVGGLVGMIGGLGGFILPIAFGALNDLTGLWSSCFMLLFVIVGACLAWMHFAVRRIERATARRPNRAFPSPRNEAGADQRHDRKPRHHRQRHGPGRMLEHLLESVPGRYSITIFNAEPRVNYDRVMLSPVLSGEKEFEQIIIHGDGWYIKNGITLYKGHKIVSIDRAARTVTSDHGVTAPYDKLVIATGSVPFILPVPGHDMPGVLTYRDLDDVNAMLLAAQSRAKAVVIGGGLLGLEAAAGLRMRDMDVTVLHIMPTLMERQLDPAAGYLLQRAVEARGIKVITKANTKAITGNGRVEAVELADGTVIPATLVVMAAGIRPNSALAKDAGIAVNRGIVVDAGMGTSDPAIYALGECAEVKGQVYGLVAPLYEMARVAAASLAGDATAAFAHIDTPTKLKVTGIDLFSLGDFADGDDRQEIVLRDASAGVYKRLVLKDNRIIGTVLYGETADGAWFNDLKKKATDITEMRDTLIFGQAYQGGAPLDPMAAVAALPDDAEICGCNGICKGKISGAIAPAAPYPTCRRPPRDRTPSGGRLPDTSQAAGPRAAARPFRARPDRASSPPRRPAMPRSSGAASGNGPRGAIIRAWRLSARFGRHRLELAAVLPLLVAEPRGPGPLRGHPQGGCRQRGGGGPGRGGPGGGGAVPRLPARPAPPEPDPLRGRRATREPRRGRGGPLGADGHGHALGRLLHGHGGRRPDRELLRARGGRRPGVRGLRRPRHAGVLHPRALPQARRRRDRDPHAGRALMPRSVEEASEVLEAARGRLAITSLAEESRPPAASGDATH